MVELEEKYPQFKSSLSPSQRIGSKVLDEFKKTKHVVKQWSFDNIFNFEELKNGMKNKKIYSKRDKNNFKVEYLCELKIDGLKIVLTYKKEFLKRVQRVGMEF